MERGGYIPTGYKFDPVVLIAKLPLEFFEARNALRIAQSEGAEKYASESYQNAVKLMDKADEYATRKDVPKKLLIAVAREAVQTAEDARQIALKRQDEERLAQERAASAERESQANAATDRAKTEADDAERARARAETDSAKALAQAERTKLEAELAAQRAARASEVAQADSEKARKAAAEQSEREKQELRNKLAVQLNLILETRDSARGLIVNMSDVLFDSGKYTLKPGAREKLAKLSGIILAYPSLKLEVEGHTDSVGTDEYNMELSENRANSVRDYLGQQGINTSSIAARGFGESQPVATNDTAAGRQQNRRVELVVSGDLIGTPSGP
jgi:outer membrane protein OmpA-like peptidoglycan-associated protein